jgi:hypothetical protein
MIPPGLVTTIRRIDMTSRTVTDQETVRQVVRGERPWTDLRAVGMQIRVEGTHCHFHNPRDVQATVNACDLAQGLRAYLHDPQKLREWAFVMEAANLDLDVETHPAGSMLPGCPVERFRVASRSWWL